MEKQKVVLAYSGGLDTSVAIQWLKDQSYDVIALCLDLGEGKDLNFVQEKALQVGAIKSLMLDVQEEFANQYVLPALQAHALYEQEYPLISALSRPLIAKKLVEVAEQEGATAVAHGCTGKGNDQVRFEVSIHALNPNLEVIAPVREWHWSRDEEIAYALEHQIPIPIDLDNPYSIDQNLWGRSCECGILEDPWNTPPEDAFELTNPIEKTPDEPAIIELQFEQGKPVALNGEKLPLSQIILQLNQLAGQHGVGRIDHVENRLIGIKSREVYEAPAAITLLKAHKALEALTLTNDVSHFKPIIEQKMADLIYNGLWFSPLKKALEAFINTIQADVTGTVRVRLHKGHAIVEGRKSPYSLYNHELATYTPDDQFDHSAAVGFITLFGLPTKVYRQVHQND